MCIHIYLYAHDINNSFHNCYIITLMCANLPFDAYLSHVPRALLESVSVRGREFVRVTKSIPPLPTHIQRKSGARGHHPSAPPPPGPPTPGMGSIWEGGRTLLVAQALQRGGGGEGGGRPGPVLVLRRGGHVVRGRRGAAGGGPCWGQATRNRGRGGGGGGGCGPKLRPKATRQSLNDPRGEARRLEKKEAAG